MHLFSRLFTRKISIKYSVKFLQLYLLLIVINSSISTGSAEPTLNNGLALQVLGSGGPETQTKRASSSYLIWLDGKARVLIDSGGGSALRFGESGAQMADLDLVLLTHLHVDHTADLPALIKSSYFETRNKPLPVFGPDGNAAFPSTVEFIQSLLGPNGAYRYLSDFLQPQSASYSIQPNNVALKDAQLKTVFNQNGIKVTAANVQHGSVPALAWRVEIAGKSIVFSGDTNGDGDNLAQLANGADIFVAHNAVPERAVGAARSLHMTPSVIGKIAAGAKVKQLVLSHLMLRTLGKESETLQAIALQYVGKPAFANDLEFFYP